MYSTAAFSDVPHSGADWDFAGLLKALGTVKDPRKRRGRMYGLVFVLAASLIAVLAGASNFGRWLIMLQTCRSRCWVSWARGGAISG